MLSFSQLNCLSLARNRLTESRPNLFQQLSNLMVLDLSKNRLNSLPKALKSLVSLQTLDMGENSVTDIDRNTMGLLASLWRCR